jgi:hypothetical protein
MASQISHSIKHRKSANDRFYTPESLVKIHLEKFKDIPDGSVIFEPFYGEGAYYNEMCKMFPNCSIKYTEIDKGLDFFEYNEKTDYIISNPPYSIIDKVLQHSVSLKPKIISYLIGFHNLTARRVEYMNNNGYYITDFHLTKVMAWYGMSLIVSFSNNITENIISIDRKVHR